ncbi:YcxB family protein [Streptomyces griseiscabiei]|uniref:YcxB family protein n=1 Tax=Streptomyces griseiscabiei TaxID=2993540 RepID=A0ABU4L0M5_9ACTN|nr:YcxB family protein [Streptomyces griseiscabiei]MDX2909236.1 YcxB family protein [Streptomyces griseiscabiei]
MAEAGGAGEVGGPTGAAGENVELVYRAVAGDFREAVRASLRASAAGRWGRGLLWFSAVAGALATAPSLALGGTPDAQVLVTPVAAVVGLVLLPRLQAHLLHRRAAARGLHRTVLDLWGVTVEHDRGTERPATWSKVSRYAETPHTFVLLGGGHAPRLTVLPKRGLADPADTDRLRAVLAREGLPRV